MGDLIFRCSECAKSLAVDQSAAGATCVCSTCKVRVRVPLPAIEFRCPFCNSDLLAPDGLGDDLFECPGCETGIPVPRLVRVEFE